MVPVIELVLDKFCYFGDMLSVDGQDMNWMEHIRAVGTTAYH